MKVVIIGSGNIATVLGRKIKDAGNEIVQVISKTKANAEQLASILNSTAEDDLLKINPDADLYILAVSDTHINGVAGEINLPGKLIVHTAGSVSKEVLNKNGAHFGVIYPIQTLKKEMEIFPPIPILVDGETPEIIEFLKRFCLQWTDIVEVADDDKRLKMHIAAVIANNFTNYLFTMAEQFCENEGLNFSTLFPLIKETCLKIEKTSPSLVQTGPALRKDISTIKLHLDHLENYPNLKGIYKVLSSSIMDGDKAK